MNHSLLVVISASAVVYGTPLLYAALGELLAERAGVLNLGVEGMMLMGAVMGFWAVQRIDTTASLALILAVAVAALAGALTSLIHAVLVISFRANQIVSGLALTIFAGATGLSSYLGNDLGLGDAPAVTRSRPSTSSASRRRRSSARSCSTRTRSCTCRGSAWRSWPCTWRGRGRGSTCVRWGDAPASADAMGISVTRYRYAHTLVGGAFAGVGGACFSLAITPQWVDGLTQGAGWIAIALVIFAFWRAELCLVGAYLFGAFSSLGFTLQARGVTIAPEFLNALPYVMTIAVLVAVSSRGAKRRLGAPAALGIPYAREER